MLRCALREEVKICFAEPERNLNSIGFGNIALFIGGYEVVVWNDAGCLDYIDSAKAPDDRRGDFESWEKWQQHPLDQLYCWERRKLEDLLCREGADVE
ncbi:hypothetical protein EG832_02505 [bacterium]|nr:hypothetical protein [bacterium]